MYVYWWHVAGLRAVKVGHAEDPDQRVSDYRSEYSLRGNDVRGFKLDLGVDAEWAERQLCRTLEARGLRRIALRLGNAEEELFALDGCTFEDAHELLRDAARHITLAEVSNQRKRQRRLALQIAEVEASRQQEQETEQAREEPHPEEQHHTSVHPAVAVTARPWLYLFGAIVVCGAVMGLRGDDSARGPESASLTTLATQTGTTAPQGSKASTGQRHDDRCTLVEISETLIHARCDGSSALMRWNGRWMLDSGQDENEALDFFNASDAARRIVALPSRVAIPELPQRAEVKPEQLPQSSQPAPPVPPPPQPDLPQVAPRPATVQSEPQPAMKPQPARVPCTVSRPKPGFQVYLVTCPNSRATIGRTVDVAAGWAVSESVNGTEAIEFFMKSPYAR